MPVSISLITEFTKIERSLWRRVRAAGHRLPPSLINWRETIGDTAIYLNELLEFSENCEANPRPKLDLDHIEKMDDLLRVLPNVAWEFDGGSWSTGNGVRHVLRADGVGLSKAEAELIVLLHNHAPALLDIAREHLEGQE